MTLRDVVFEMTHTTEYKVHRRRGDEWGATIRQDQEDCKRKAAMLRSNRSEYTVFRIAQINALPVLVVRDIEAAILVEVVA
ncbi:hypothetical protein MKZ26_20155 [Sporosarcina sp. FSL K6-6792]|uniref:hypothetical protein n=1 Tax=Sporosarcina sp. FSL K6-6792 TaxID=2921559 RepID=UPI0030FB871A